MTARIARGSAPPPEGSAGGAAVHGAEPRAEAALEWEENPWRENARAALTGAVLTLALAALLAGVARPIGSSPGAMAALVVLLAHSLSASWWPSRYRVDGDGVAARRPFPWRRIPWAGIRRAALIERPGMGVGLRRVGRVDTQTGLFVSTLARPGRLDAFRGLFLPLPGGPDRERVASGIRLALARHGF